MEISREHYQQLVENFKHTRHLMSDADCETMRLKLNTVREALAYKACVMSWNAGETINCYDFLKVCKSVGVAVSESVYAWVMSDIIEVGKHSYSCIGKLHKRKEHMLQKICQELTENLK